MEIEFILNEKPVKLEADPERTLLTVLRDDLGLTGTKCGCDTGDCGACSILLDDKLAKSCLLKIADMQGRKVTTIEGIHGEDGGISDLQESFLQNGAIQCGYCIPAMVLAGESLLRQNPDPDRQEIRNGISRVLCRCIGYQQIVDAIEQTAHQRQRTKNQIQNSLESVL